MAIVRRSHGRALAGVAAAVVALAAGCDLGTRARVVTVAPEGQHTADVAAGASTDARSVAGGREVVAAALGGDARPDLAYLTTRSLVVLVNALDR
jgi:hypothetical protein